jgi:RNA polymerase sigma factor (TIGR02999 family)
MDDTPVRPTEHNATQLLIAWGNGDKEALDQLVPLVYKELHRLARFYMNRERPNHSLQPTDLINKAYVELIEWKPVGLKDRAHFIGVAARLMRNILVDHAVEHRKQGIQVSLSEADDGAQEIWGEIVALDDALTDLGKRYPLKLQLVELRHFGGLTMKEVSEVLGKPLRTLEHEWTFTKAWLKCELDKRQKIE